jgi:hypothetical protein
MFESVDGWRERLTEPEPSGWIEQSFTDAAKGQVRVLVENNHAYTEPEKLSRGPIGDALFHDHRRIPFYHFRRTKEWPL